MNTLEDVNKDLQSCYVTLGPILTSLKDYGGSPCLLKGCEQGFRALLCCSESSTDFFGRHLQSFPLFLHCPERVLLTLPIPWRR